jgi:hypothetical protein
LKSERERGYKRRPMAAPISACHICGDPTINAHLFPRALARDMRGKHKHLYVGGVAAPGRRTVQSGLVDKTILCATHDGILGEYDHYGIQFCRTFAAKATWPMPGIWEVAGIDGDKLTRFWLASLWRFGISNLPEALGVTLGAVEPVIRDILFNGASCSTEPAVMIVRYRARVIPAENICFPPYVSAFFGSTGNAYGLAIGGFQAFVKVDGPRLAAPYPALTINGKTDITGGTIQFEGTEQYRRSVQIAGNIARRP